MRAGLSTIQQTLTPEAASVLTRSIAEAARRSHGQTTPLHVAATLLAEPCGVLRHACVRSHPQSSHPLQCRALELCFSVALDRVPPSNPPAGGGGCGDSVAEPPISNALMAALKRAQANQRRGCPEQQQQPLLAVKVELEQLLISILDDPSVSRVMREASFSSVAVKTAVEQSLSSSSAAPAAAAPAPSISALATATAAAASPPVSSRFLSLTNRASTCHSLYMNPRLHQLQANGEAASAGSSGGDQPRTEEVKRVLDIFSRPRKRNPILVGDCNPDAVMREVLQRIQSGDVPPPLRDAQLLPFPKEIASAGLSQIPTKIRELRSSIDSAIGGVILDLGDLKWLVESNSNSTCSGPTQPPKPIVSEAGRVVVEVMGRLLKRFQGGDRLWLVGTASCTTYLRCQVYHPAMENDWDLQAVPIAARSSIINTSPRFGGKGILSSSVVKLAPMKSAGIGDAAATAAAPLRQPPVTASAADSPRRSALCSLCLEGYERELAILAGEELEKYSPKPETTPTLPQWLQLAKPPPLKSEEMVRKKNSDELLKKWTETCSKSHISSGMPWVQPKPLAIFKQLPGSLSPPPPDSNLDSIAAAAQPLSPPRSPVRTDLVLGRSKVSHSTADNKTHEDRLKDFTGCAQNACSNQHRPQIAAGISDMDAFKRLFRGLSEKVGWQPEAASAIAAAVMRSKSGNGKQRPKGDAWFLLVGPDKVGKRKMASALSELMFGTGPTFVNFGSASYADGNDGESNFSHRGRTCTDRIVEAVRRNPFSVIVLEDIDRADILVQGKIKQAMQRGHLPDSHGREVSLGSVVFVLIADWLPEELRSSYHSLFQYEEKMLDPAHCGWELELSTGDRPGKRHHYWTGDGDDRPVKPRKESPGSAGLTLDLNLSLGADAAAEAGEGSRNSSDVSTEQDCDKGRLAVGRPPSSLTSELVELADEAITFKPVDFGTLRKKVADSASAKFAAVMGKGRAMRIDEDALDRIVGGLWLNGAAFDEWAERVLVPSLRQLRGNLRADSDGLVIVRLSTVKGGRGEVDGWLPATVAVAIDGAIDS